jgi:hypothetical protein
VAALFVSVLRAAFIVGLVIMFSTFTHRVMIRGYVSAFTMSCPHISLSRTMSSLRVLHGGSGGLLMCFGRSEKINMHRSWDILTRSLARKHKSKHRKNFFELDIIADDSNKNAMKATASPDSIEAVTPQTVENSAESGVTDDVFWASVFMSCAGPSAGQFVPRFDILAYPNEKVCF